MATIDGRPAQYGITLKQLRDLMEHRGREGVARVNDLGGVQEICKKLYTSPSEGKFLLIFFVLREYSYIICLIQRYLIDNLRYKRCFFYLHFLF